MLGTVLEVDQGGSLVEGEVNEHPVIDTGATRSTVRTSEVLNLPLLGKQVQVAGISNRHFLNHVSASVPVKIVPL